MKYTRMRVCNCLMAVSILINRDWQVENACVGHVVLFVPALVHFINIAMSSRFVCRCLEYLTFSQLLLC